MFEEHRVELDEHYMAKFQAHTETIADVSILKKKKLKLIHVNQSNRVEEIHLSMNNYDVIDLDDDEQPCQTIQMPSVKRLHFTGMNSTQYIIFFVLVFTFLTEYRYF